MERDGDSKHGSMAKSSTQRDALFKPWSKYISSTHRAMLVLRFEIPTYTPTLSNTWVLTHFCFTPGLHLKLFSIPGRNGYGWLSKCWFLSSALLPHLHWGSHCILWAYHTFISAKSKIKYMLCGRRSTAGSFFNPRCPQWCHYCWPLLACLACVLVTWNAHCLVGRLVG